MSAEELDPLQAQRQMHFRLLVAAAKAETTASSRKQRHRQDLLRAQNSAVHKPQRRHRRADAVPAGLLDELLAAPVVAGDQKWTVVELLRSTPLSGGSATGQEGQQRCHTLLSARIDEHDHLFHIGQQKDYVVHMHAKYIHNCRWCCI